MNPLPTRLTRCCVSRPVKLATNLSERGSDEMPKHNYGGIIPGDRVRTDPIYMATWTDADGDILTATPFHALSDTDAREAGESMISFVPPGGRVRVCDLGIGYWDGACFSTSQDRVIFDSQYD